MTPEKEPVTVLTPQRRQKVILSLRGHDPADLHHVLSLRGLHLLRAEMTAPLQEPAEPTVNQTGDHHHGETFPSEDKTCERRFEATNVTLTHKERSENF